MYSVDDVENLCDILNTLSYNPYLFVQTMFEWDKGILKGQQIEEWQKDILLTKTWAELQKWHNLSFIKDFFQWQATSISTKEKDKVKSIIDYKKTLI